MFNNFAHFLGGIEGDRGPQGGNYHCPLFLQVGKSEKSAEKWPTTI